MKRSIFFFFFFIFVFFNIAIAADEITGQVVKVEDGDVIVVLTDSNEKIIVRLAGIDSPEKGQAFGDRARESTSGMVLWENVSVIPTAIEKDLVLGLVYINNKSLNEHLVKKGFAWVYKEICTMDVCDKWVKYEQEARSSKIGLWRKSKPMSPWDFRKKIISTVRQQQKRKPKGIEIIYSRDYKKEIFHKYGCVDFNCRSCYTLTKKEALSRGSEPCEKCNP